MMPQKRVHSVASLPKRIDAFDRFLQLVKTGNLSRHEIVTAVSEEFGVSNVTVYAWFHGGTPYGKRAGRIAIGRNLFYAIGALLGDGNIYFWRNTYEIWLLGEREFASKFARKISSCLDRNVPFYPYR